MYGSFDPPRKGAPRQRWKDPLLVEMRVKFNTHKANAKMRGIPFLLSFDEWRALWVESGKWHERGAARGQYVMCRPGDKGPYAIGNVKIVLAEENRAEKARNYPLRGSRNGAFGKNYWAAQTPEARAARRAVLSAKSLGRPKSPNTREAMRKKATGRRRVIREGRSTWAYPGDADFPA